MTLRLKHGPVACANRQGTFSQSAGKLRESVPTPFLSDWQETSEMTGEVSRRRLIVNLNDRGAQLQGRRSFTPRTSTNLEARFRKASSLSSLWGKTC